MLVRGIPWPNALGLQFRHSVFSFTFRNTELDKPCELNVLLAPPYQYLRKLRRTLDP